MYFKYLTLLCAVIAIVHSKTIILGQIIDHSGIVKMFEQRVVERNSIPFFKRTDEEKFYTPGQTIRGIAMKDIENGLAEPSVTSGGLGFDYATIKLKSERGSGYKFILEIYAS
ncbi:unnamed protein product [Diatraea saccharalis]|uniref:Salivary secreted peptide n=1 Tax=Diatraea saccharalis TaxID=40085 RepID=A0A9N9WGW2_9NEOP|nr:unnamed protein product [Diatraea saccharalis]